MKRTLREKTSATASGTVVTAKSCTTLRPCSTSRSLARPEAADAMAVNTSNQVTSSALKSKETVASAGRKRGRPARDYASEVGRVYSHLQINSLEGRNESCRVMVLTTCLMPGCGVVSVKRLDKLKNLTTVSCGCVKRANYLKWLETSASRVSPERQAEIWGDAQVMSRRELHCKYATIRAATIDQVVRSEQKRVSAVLDAHGRAIASRAENSNFDPIAKEFGLTVPVVKWIVGRTKVRALTGPQNKTAAAARVEAPTSSDRDVDAEYLYELRVLRATVEDIGWGHGKRRVAVFNGKELTFMKSGGTSGPAYILYLWAMRQTSADPETAELKAWLLETIVATGKHRKELRTAFALKARKAAKKQEL
jgi:hypothetical protein